MRFADTPDPGGREIAGEGPEPGPGRIPGEAPGWIPGADPSGDAPRPSGWASWIARLEERLVGLLDRGASAVASWRAHRLLGDPAYLRGRECHCPRGAPLHLLHSEGIREGCDFVVDYGSNVEHPRRRPIPVEILGPAARRWPPGAVIHVKADLMDRFVRHVLPEVRHPIVLVTGDSDWAPVRAFAGLLEDRRIAHWFAQNCDLPGRHPRLTRLPIGFDNPVYTRLDKRIGFLLTMLLGRTPWDWTLLRNDIGNQQLLQAVRAEIPTRPSEKPLRALCTFQCSGKLVRDVHAVPGRWEAYLEVKDNPACWLPEERLRQEACWRVHGDFAFEVSPRGRGLDCFRTWEAIFLGTIPIVRSSPLDPMFEDEHLPVMLVDRFRDITATRLERWRAAAEERFTRETLDRLTVDHWLERIRGRSLEVSR